MFGRWHTDYQRFNHWCRSGVWENLFKVLSDDTDFEYILVGSTIVAPISTVPVPQKSDRSEHRFETHTLGRSKGGLNTKVHAAIDALGNPVRFILTGGERNDMTQIEGLLEGLTAGHVLADKGYDDNAPWTPSLRRERILSFRVEPQPPVGAASTPQSTKTPT